MVNRSSSLIDADEFSPEHQRRSAPIMKLLISCIALLLAQPASAAEPPSKRNPALIYWQALALMPELGNEQAKLMADVISGNRRTDEPAVAALFKDANRALKLFHRAAHTAGDCEWGLILEDGPFMVMPHTAKLPMLLRLALCRAQQHFAAGNNDEALDWIITVRKAARHAAAGDLLIPVLIQFTAESQANVVTAGHLLALSPEQRAVHAKTLKSLPPLRSVAQAALAEMNFVDWVECDFNRLGETLKTDDLKKITPKNPTSEEQAESIGGTLDPDMKALSDQLTRSTVHQLTDQARSYYTLASRACTKPWKDGNAELDQITATIKAGDNMLARIIFPNFIASRERELRLVMESTMLQVALVFGADLISTPMKDYRDGFDDHPFVVHRDGESFIISTAQEQAVRGHRATSLRIAK